MTLLKVISAFKLLFCMLFLVFRLAAECSNATINAEINNIGLPVEHNYTTSMNDSSVRKSWLRKSNKIYPQGKFSTMEMEIKPVHVHRAPHRGKVRTVHEHAAVTFQSRNIHKAQAALNVWQPYVTRSDGEFSLSQIWVIHQNDHGEVEETVEAGWMVRDPAGGKPKIFVYYSTDGYRTGCYNVNCRGFVVDNTSPYILDEPIRPVSTYQGNQTEISISINRELRNGAHVWAVYIQGHRMGHYPGSLFKNLGQAANRVDFGGEVAFSSTGVGTPRSRTDMASGRFAEEGHNKAAYVRNMELFEGNGALVTNRARQALIQENPKCYDVLVHHSQDKLWGTYMFFGGAGGDLPGCFNVS